MKLDPTIKEPVKKNPQQQTDTLKYVLQFCSHGIEADMKMIVHVADVVENGH